MEQLIVPTFTLNWPSSLPASSHVDATIVDVNLLTIQPFATRDTIHASQRSEFVGALGNQERG
jgi:hypothetical protein